MVVEAAILAIFVVVYLGMILGGLPFLQLDRTGVALLGAIAVIGVGALSPEQAALAVHLPTILLLFSFMVISAQMRLGGFYTWVTLRIATLPLAPAPVLADACVRRRLDPVPFLLALASASNIGSAATLIGNPQNMLIGQVLELPFGTYLLEAAGPVLLGLAAAWGLIAWQARGSWGGAVAQPPAERRDELAALERWQSAKGLVVAAALIAVFLLTSWPREVAALTGAGLLLMSRKLHSTKMLGLVDWELLILFMGLFVVNRALADTGLTAQAVRALAESDVPLGAPAPLFAATFVLSNVVSNVPAVMLLLPAATEPFSGPMLALVSTLAGNLFIVGSIANIIVVDAARRRGIAIGWRRHARTGVPVTILTLAITAGWFALRT